MRAELDEEDQVDRDHRDCCCPVLCESSEASQILVVRPDMYMKV
jgi:hypothetical protein